MSLNTVAQCDIRLLRMELDWKLNRSGPFPEGTRNAIADLRAALVIREAEASQKTPAPANAATPASTSTPANTAASPTTTTTILTHNTTAATVKPQHESESGKGESKGRKPNEEKKEKRTEEEESEKSAEREEREIVRTRRDEGGEGEQIAHKASAKEGENEKRETVSERIEESRSEVRGNPPPPAAHTAHSATPHGPQRFDWATETDRSIGPVPNVSDFRSTKPPSPLVSPNPAPRLSDSPTTPPQPVRTPLQPIRARTSTMGAPSNCTLAAYTPAAPIHSMHASTAPVDPVPVSTTKRCVPITALPQVSAEHAPTVIVHGPRDLSALRSDAPNPWGSLRRRHYGCYPHVLHQVTCRRQHRQKYPMNTHVRTASTPKPPAPTPIRVFETIRHPLGIGPTKPVIRVPVSTATEAVVDPTQYTPQPIVKSKLILPQRQSNVTIQCQCGRLIPVSHSTTIFPLHNILTTLISGIFSYPFSLPTHFFSRFGFS